MHRITTYLMFYDNKILVYLSLIYYTPFYPCWWREREHTKFGKTNNT